MPILEKSRKAWGSEQFDSILKTEVEQLGLEHLPLQQGMSQSSYALDDKLKSTVLGVTDDADFIHARLGLFYTGVIAGCSCADDPTPEDEITEYCEISIDIDKLTAAGNIKLLSD